ncbi:MAG: hypothetical protein JWQ37_1031 [Blastococcus sp.]|nr:hypothetical protein [Blastococcus sp.]
MMVCTEFRGEARAACLGTAPDGQPETTGRRMTA